MRTKNIPKLGVNVPLPSNMLLRLPEFSASLFFQIVIVSLIRSSMPQFINLSLRQYHPWACRRHTPQVCRSFTKHPTLHPKNNTYHQLDFAVVQLIFCPLCRPSIQATCLSLYKQPLRDYMKCLPKVKANNIHHLSQRTINLPLINSNHTLGLPVPEHGFQEDLLHHLPRHHSQADLPIDPDTPSHSAWIWSWCLLFFSCLIWKLWRQWPFKDEQGNSLVRIAPNFRRTLGHIVLSPINVYGLWPSQLCH